MKTTLASTAIMFVQKCITENVHTNSLSVCTGVIAALGIGTAYYKSYVENQRMFDDNRELS